jgi:hypothetical protein
MLKELKVLLELLECVTDEFQAYDVTISRVIPTLRTKLYDISYLMCLHTPNS